MEQEFGSGRESNQHGCAMVQALGSLARSMSENLQCGLQRWLNIWGLALLKLEDLNLEPNTRVKEKQNKTGVVMYSEGGGRQVCFCCLLASSQPPSSERNQRSKAEVTKQDTDVLLCPLRTHGPPHPIHSPQLWGCLCCILEEEEKVARERTARCISGREACVWKDC